MERARYMGQFYCSACSAESPAQSVWSHERMALCRRHFMDATGQAPPRARDATELDPEPPRVESEPPRRYRCGKDTTIERTAGGGVRLVRWRQVQDIGTVSETVHEWTADGWVECVVFVSAPHRLDDEMNRTLVLHEIARIHSGR